MHRLQSFSSEYLPDQVRRQQDFRLAQHPLWFRLQLNHCCWMETLAEHGLFPGGRDESSELSGRICCGEQRPRVCDTILGLGAFRQQLYVAPPCCVLGREFQMEEESHVDL